MHNLTMQSFGHTLLRIFLQWQGTWSFNQETLKTYIHNASMYNILLLMFYLTLSSQEDIFARNCGKPIKTKSFYS